MPELENSKDAFKTDFLNVPINEHQKDLIGRAAALRKVSVSEFVIEKAYDAATQVLADKSHFVLSSEKWDEFCNALDAPPNSIPGLKKLFAAPNPFHDRSFESPSRCVT